MITGAYAPVISNLLLRVGNNSEGGDNMVKSPIQVVDYHPTNNQQTNRIIDYTIKNLPEILTKYLPINEGKIVGSSISNLYED